MFSLLSFIVALGILIFVHELGHFIVAKLLGVRVEKFSLGFGPKLFGFGKGETEYLISALPLGGYVKMTGESEDSELTDEERKVSFTGKSPSKRIAIVAAGPLFNIFFAWFVYVTVLLMGTPFETSKVLVIKGMPAERAGLQNNDVITAINAKPIRLWEEVFPAVASSNGKPLQVSIRRNGAELKFMITPQVTSDKNLLGEITTSPKIGIMPSGEKVIERFGLGKSITLGSQQVVNVTSLIGVVLGKIIIGAIPAIGNVGGPISIAVEAGKQAAAGLSTFMLLLAGLSVNLGVLNLLPIPILDGGHIVFNFWEMFSGKAPTPKVRELAQQVGLVILIGLMSLAFYTDIVKYVFKHGQ